MAQTSFTGPVVSINGFAGNVSATNVSVTNLTIPATAASNAANFTATTYVTIKGADGNTYYVAARTSAW
jgi:hypothetical protein